MPLEIITGSRRSPDDNAALRSTISDHRCIVNMDPGFRRGDNHAFAVRLFISISPFPSLPSPFAPFSISPFSLLTSQFALHFHFSLRFPPSHFAVFSIPYPPSPIPSLSTIHYQLSTPAAIDIHHHRTEIEPLKPCLRGSGRWVEQDHAS